jgi:predicted nucleic acid-binding protein
MIMVDTSAWVEFLRDTGSDVCARVDDLMGQDIGDIAICDPVRMEVLAGARNQRHLEDLQRLLARATVMPTDSIDFDTAGRLYRICRGNGETVRKLLDCLIASVSMRAGLPVLHADADFDVLARHAGLLTHP